MGIDQSTPWDKCHSFNTAVSEILAQSKASSTVFLRCGRHGKRIKRVWQRLVGHSERLEGLLRLSSFTMNCHLFSSIIFSAPPEHLLLGSCSSIQCSEGANNGFQLLPKILPECPGMWNFKEGLTSLKITCMQPSWIRNPETLWMIQSNLWNFRWPFCWSLDHYFPA